MYQQEEIQMYILIFPVPVQGEGASEKIAKGIEIYE